MLLVPHPVQLLEADELDALADAMVERVLDHLTRAGRTRRDQRDS